jgi:hypothetical protein
MWPSSKVTVTCCGRKKVKAAWGEVELQSVTAALSPRLPAGLRKPQKLPQVGASATQYLTLPVNNPG